MIWITNFPVPPSTNDLYETTGRAVIKVNKQGKKYYGVKTSRYGSKELQHYKAQCKSFYNLNHKALDEIAIKIKSWISQGYVIRMDSFVAFEYSRVWSKENQPKQIDADNRRKALQDSICEILGIDDKFVFSGIMEKVTCENEEQCLINFQPLKPRTINDIRILKG